MGQFIEVLNNQANLDDLNLNLESFQGGLDCNVDEVNFTINHLHSINLFQCLHKFFINFFLFFFFIFHLPPPTHCAFLKVIKHELSYGPLDFNFQNNNQDGMIDTTAATINGGDAQQQHNHGQYQQARTTSNSWVH